MATYTDAELTAAIADAHSWRGVLRLLGLPPQSAGAHRRARARAIELGLDVAHFTGQRRWSDDELRVAVTEGRSWGDVFDHLGLSRTSGSARASLTAHAARLGLDVRHLDPTPPPPTTPFARPSSVTHLDRAGPMLAAAWFTLRGFDVAWPLEPARYDLLVTDGARNYRVQVKTTTTRAGDTWAARISSNRPRGTVVYTPDEVDYFFVIDGELTCYLIPLAVVGGYQLIHLRRYAQFAVGTLLGAA